MDIPSPTGSVRELDLLISPPKRYLIEDGRVRAAAGAVFMGAGAALVGLRFSEIDTWPNHSFQAAFMTLGSGAALHAAWEILLSDKSAAKFHEVVGRYAFPTSMMIAQFQRNPIAISSDEDLKLWEAAFVGAYNMIIGVSIMLRISSVFRKNLSQEGLDVFSPSSSSHKPLFLEGSLVKTQAFKIAAAAALIALSHENEDASPYTPQLGFLIIGHILGVTILGKGLDMLERHLENRRGISDEFEDLTNKWDALRALNVSRRFLHELGNPTIGVLFFLLAQQTSFIGAASCNASIGMIVGAQKWTAERNIPHAVSLLKYGEDSTVLKTQKIGLGILATTMLAWYGYALYETWDEPKDITVLSSFVGGSFLSFFLTLLLDRGIDEKPLSSFQTSLRFYMTMFRIMPLFYLFFTQESRVNLDSEVVEVSDNTSFGLEVAGWASLGLSLGNHLAQRPQAFSLSDFMFMIFAQSFAFELGKLQN